MPRPAGLYLSVCSKQGNLYKLTEASFRLGCKRLFASGPLKKGLEPASSSSSSCHEASIQHHAMVRDETTLASVLQISHKQIHSWKVALPACAGAPEHALLQPPGIRRVASLRVARAGGSGWGRPSCDGESQARCLRANESAVVRYELPSAACLSVPYFLVNVNFVQLHVHEVSCHSHDQLCVGGGM